MIKNAIGIFDFVCTDGNYGLHHADLVCLNLYLSEHLWLAGEHDMAFDALNAALEHAKKFENICEQDEVVYTAPLLSMIKIKLNGNSEKVAASLSEDWPWWHIPDPSKVKAEMEANPRWEEWVEKHFCQFANSITFGSFIVNTYNILPDFVRMMWWKKEMSQNSGISSTAKSYA